MEMTGRMKNDLRAGPALWMLTYFPALWLSHYNPANGIGNRNRKSACSISGYFRAVEHFSDRENIAERRCSMRRGLG